MRQLHRAACHPAKIDIRLTSQIFGKLLSLPMEFFERNLAGVISKHMQQDQKIREFSHRASAADIAGLRAPLLVFIPGAAVLQA